MPDRNLLGQNLTFEERISLAQLTTQPGWKILVRLMAEACRNATEEVIKLNPTVPRYPEVLAGLQTTARAMNKFSAEVLDSIRVHQQKTVKEAQDKESPESAEIKSTRFQGFKPPVPQSPSEGAK